MNNNKSLKVKSILERNIRNITLKVCNEHLIFVSINKIEITNDLSIASIYCSFFNQDQYKKNFNKLVSLEPYVRHELSQNISLYKTPVIKFVYDDRFIIDEQMDELLKKDQAEIKKIKKS